MPTPLPTYVPTPLPTPVPTPGPSFPPTPLPTPYPTYIPTPVPTKLPTPVPTPVPTPTPTQIPTANVYYAELCEMDNLWTLMEGIWNWDFYYNHTCFMKLGGAFETEDNNQAWLSPMKYPMASGWRNTKTKVEFVLPGDKAIMFMYFRIGQMGHTDDSTYAYACRYHYGTFEIVSVAGTIKRTVASTTIASLTDHKEFLVEATAVNDRLFCYLYDGDGSLATVVKGTSHMHTSGTVGLRTDTEVWFRNMIVMAWGGQ